MKIVIAFSTLMLCLVTLASTVLFWTSMPTDIYGKALAGVTAAALEACKYAFFPAGFYYLKKRNPGGFGLLLMGVVLVVISVAATTGFLQNAYNQHAKAEQQNSLEYQTKKQQLNSLQQQIDTLNSLIAADAAGSYRTRALQTAEEVKKLEHARNQALAEIKTYRESPQGNAQALYAAWALPLGVSPETLRQGAFMGLAIIVDICAIAGLLALGGLAEKIPQAETKTDTAATTKAAQQKQQKPEQPAPQNSEQLNEREQQIANAILSGKYGQPISVRGVIAGEKTHHPVASKVLQHLIQKNLVQREGKQFHLKQPVLV